jgi:hypothetical protein
VLVLGGGAPNATLMAGAVHTFLRRKVHFDVVVGSGAGALIGLLYLVPKDKSPEEALALTPNYGIHDLLYSLLRLIPPWVPVDYKAFQPPLPSEAARRLINLTTFNYPTVGTLQYHSGRHWVCSRPYDGHFWPSSSSRSVHERVIARCQISLTMLDIRNHS